MPEKTHKYKFYDGAEFVGIAPNVLSDFRYNQELNTAGAELQIELGESLDSAGATLETSALIKEDGDNILLDSGDNLLISSEFVFSTVPINVANRVEVWCYYSEAPEGIKVFDGIITKWRTNIAESKITVTVVSQGIKMEHQLIQVLPDTEIINNDSTDDTEALFTPAKPAQNRIIAGAQTFQHTADTTIKTFSIGLGNSGSFAVPMTVSLVEGDPTSPGSTLASVSRNIDPGASQLIEFTFPNAPAIDANTEYHFKITNDGFGSSNTNAINLAINSTSTYANGQAYYQNDSSGWSGSATEDIQFIVKTESGAIGNVFNSYDPSDIAREILDNFQALGGDIGYDANSIADTNRTVSYTFKFSTVFEGILKCLELAPGNWYFYVDVGTGLLYFNRQAKEPDHTFVLGQHIKALDLEYTLEELANLVYFSGGDDGTGANVFRTNQNLASQETYGTWLKKEYDNRVTLDDTADTLSKSVLQQKAYPVFKTSVTIFADVYDIENITLGQMVSFRTKNNLANSLLLQITGIERTPYFATLKLDTLPPAVSKRIEDIRRNLHKLETIDNPDRF